MSASAATQPQCFGFIMLINPLSSLTKIVHQITTSEILFLLWQYLQFTAKLNQSLGEKHMSQLRHLRGVYIFYDSLRKLSFKSSISTEPFIRSLCHLQMLFRRTLLTGWVWRAARRLWAACGGFVLLPYCSGYRPHTTDLNSSFPSRGFQALPPPEAQRCRC